MAIIEKNRMFTDPNLGTLLKGLVEGVNEARVGGLCCSAKSLFISLVFKLAGRPLVVICPDAAEARNFVQDLSVFMDPAQVVLLPEWEIRSTDFFSTQRDTELSRMGALFRLYRGERAVFVVPLGAALQKVVPRCDIREYVRPVSIGDALDRDRFMATLEAGGYHRVPIVEEEGEYSVRGHVLDIFPPVMPNPVRLVFLGDEIESIKEFDAASQRSIRELVEFDLPPARELVMKENSREIALRNMRTRANDLALPRTVKDRLSDAIDNGLFSSVNPLFMPLFYQDDGSGAALTSLSDYFPADSLVVFEDGFALSRAGEELEKDLERILDKAAQEERFYLSKESLFIDLKDLYRDFGRLQRVRLEDLEIGEGGDGLSVRFRTEANTGLKRETSAGPSAGASSASKGGREESLLAPLVAKMQSWIEQGNLIAFLCAGEEGVNRISHLLEKHALPVSRSSAPLLREVERHDGRGRLILRDGRVSGGFQFPGLRLILVSEEEIFGKKVRRRKGRFASEGYFLKSFGELKEGDLVVHTEHGVGVYRGLDKLEIGGIENDFLRLEYQEGDKLFIPVDRLDQIQRYIGPDGGEARVDRLGGTAWETAKKRAKRSAEEIAHELVSIYAAREALDRKPFHPVDEYYEEFEESFEFEETPDQAKAIEEINLDMDEDKPMDRLICGDAGFGKTEVAIRASFRAVMDGKQVAVLVPTTILAEQHYQTFTRRLASYPIRIEALDRFRTRADQNRIAEEIGKGGIDIVVGTHRLLQKDVEFKNLGLVVVDEEQRFGVNDKEKLKKLRTMVDVLTLSATPIPRTLELSLVGIRDLSIINTPPVDRQAVRTYVLEFDRDAVGAAIRQELARGGQVFFIHDRIHSIHGMERLLRETVPEAKVVVAHGRMKPRELEKVMVSFIRREYDVLLSTTIVGSGIDIPSANTIIINRADRFGLSQLYQLRGRVGRSKEEAFAHLLIPRGAVLSPETRKRLQVVKDFTEPGSGFRIAAQDLELRGAGNLLGASQSGHIAAVGYELYIQLLETTIKELKGEKPDVAEEIRPEIRLGIPAFIPESYIPDMGRRLTYYKRISSASSDEELADVRTELEDTCGFLPPQVENLLEVISLRNLLKPIFGKKLEYDGREMLLSFHQQSPIDPAKIIRLTQKKSRRAKFTPDLKLRVPMPGVAGPDLLVEAKGLIRELAS